MSNKIMLKDLNHLINGEDVYKNVKPKRGKKFNDPCVLDIHCLDYVLEQKPNPELIVELGSWHGTSAIFMAKAIKAKGLKTKILCCDTFLGSYFHRVSDYWKPRLMMKRGQSRLYQDFLGNVVANDVQDIIIPYVGTSLDACRFLQHYKIQPDLVFVDASHEFIDVYLDITHFWGILKVSGIIFGDDFSKDFLGVVQAVAHFSAEFGIQIIGYNDKFILTKKKEGLDRVEQTQING